MTMVLLIVLIAVPLVEIAVMIKVGQWIGFWPAFSIVIGTFILGASILAQSGLSAAFKVQEAMVKGEPPVAAMLDGALLAMAGILLATPGFIADVFGLALLIPPVRRLIAHWSLGSVFMDAEVHVSRGTFDDRFDDEHRGDAPGTSRPSDGGPVIEGEFERLDERPLRPGERRRRQEGDPGEND